MDGKRRMTRAFIRFALDLLFHCTIDATAEILGVSWYTVKDLHKEKLKKMYPDIPYEEIRIIGIDEFSIRKGHEYMTIVTDLESGIILYAVAGKNKEAILPFLKKLAIKAPNLKAVAMDLGDAFTAAVKEALPNASIVYDHFHVTALINKSIDDIRKEQQALTDKKGMKTIKGSRYLLLYNYENLNAKKKDRLTALLSANEPLSVAYTLKEQFRLFWTRPNEKEGAQFLLHWIMDAVKTGIKPLIKLAGTLLEHSVGLLNYFTHRISNGMTEGINNKIKTLKRQAYGYRDDEYFKLRLYHLHRQNYALAG
jgi:transposase